MNMIMKSFFYVCFLLLPASLLAQTNEQRPQQEEKIQALEVAFISRKLNLTTEEAQKFWPIYNEYKKDMRSVLATGKDKTNRDIVEVDQKMVDVRKKYKDRFSGAIGQPRMNKFFEAEREFRGVLLNRLRKNPGERPMHKRLPKN